MATSPRSGQAVPLDDLPESLRVAAPEPGQPVPAGAMQPPAVAPRFQGAPVQAGIGRSMLQGLTFGFADEAEAAMRARATSGPRYEQELARVRAGIKQYEEQYPVRAFAGEATGSLLPTVAGIFAAPFTGGASTAATAASAARIPGLASMMARGAGTAAATGALTGA